MKASLVEAGGRSVIYVFQKRSFSQKHADGLINNISVPWVVSTTIFLSIFSSLFDDGCKISSAFSTSILQALFFCWDDESIARLELFRANFSLSTRKNDVHSWETSKELWWVRTVWSADRGRLVFTFFSI